MGVERGQCVTVLNSDDPDWYWVSKFDGQEGFVPSGFIYPLDAIQRQRTYYAYNYTERLYFDAMYYVNMRQKLFSQLYVKIYKKAPAYVVLFKRITLM